ncbi:unnamed protein product [Amoebophrya sp. A25]|nr:unnamed protein product [Amoebophrya sp. A25]|eukprot:GSA25T00018996001.1
MSLYVYLDIVEEVLLGAIRRSGAATLCGGGVEAIFKIFESLGEQKQRRECLTCNDLPG